MIGPLSTLHLFSILSNHFVVCLGTYTRMSSHERGFDSSDAKSANTDTDLHQSRATSTTSSSTSRGSHIRNTKKGNTCNNSQRDDQPRRGPIVKPLKQNQRAKVILWGQYKRLVPKAKDRTLSYRSARTSDITRELRRLHRQNDTSLSTAHVHGDTSISTSTSSPATHTTLSPLVASTITHTSPGPTRSSSVKQSTRIAMKRGNPNERSEMPPNYFALSLPSTPVNVDSVVNDLVTSERSRFGDTEIVEHPNDPVVQRHYFNNVHSREDIMHAVDSVYQTQNRTCKMNVRFGLILEKDGQYQLMDATKSESTMFGGTNLMPTIKNSDDLQHHIKDEIDGDSLRDKFDYPDSDAQICGVWQVMVETFGMSFPMGAGAAFIDDMADVDDEDDAELSDGQYDCSDMEDFIVDDLSDTEPADHGSHLRISALLRDDEHKTAPLSQTTANVNNSSHARRLSPFLKTPAVAQVNLCFWACLAMKQGQQRKRCTRHAKRLFYEYYGESKSVKEYPGVQLCELLDIERAFKINILLYTNESDPRLIFRGAYKYPCDHNVHLFLIGGDVHENEPLHVALVTQPDRFFNRVTCTSCGKIFATQHKMRRHLSANSCHKDRDVFVKSASVYTPRENAVHRFTRKWNKPDRIQNNPFTRYYASFDYESMLVKIPQRSISDSEKDRASTSSKASNPPQKRSRVDASSSGPSTRFLSEHIPVSVSIQSNVPGFEGPKFIYSEDPFKLNQEFYEHLTSMADHVKTLELQRFEVDETICDGAQRRDFDKMFMFPILGFNSGKYDLMLGQNSGLFHYFNDGGIEHPIKRGTRYLQMRLEKSGITFLDILNYMPPGTSLDSYIKGFGIKHGKFVFPYEWFDSYDKLRSTDFPPLEAFYSSLRGESIDEPLYQEAKALFDTQCDTMLDFLKFYNNRDVGPFLEAITEHFKFFKEQGLDMFQDGMTVSSLAEKLMFKFAHGHDVTRDELLALSPGEPFDIDDETLQRRIDSYKE